jgi:hypothetical protein
MFKSLPKSFFFLLVLFVGGLGIGYFLFSQSAKTPALTLGNSPAPQDLTSPTLSPSPSPTATLPKEYDVEPLISQLKKHPKAGWQVSAQTQNGVAFFYPSSFRETSSGLQSKRGLDQGFYPVEISFDVSVDPNGQVTRPSTEVAPLVIQGQKYTFTSFDEAEGGGEVLPDGFQCSGGFEATHHFAKLRENLYVTVVTGRNQDNCNSKHTMVMKNTSPADIQTARSILQTVVFVKV